MVQHAKLRIFISSPRGPKIDTYRQKAIDIVQRLGFEPVFMEEFVPQRANTAEYCREQVASCDAMVLLVAYKYGSLVRDMEVSYTELEYNTAVSIPSCEILVWEASQDSEWSRAEISQGPDEVRLERFKKRLHEHTVAQFSDMERFATDLVAAIQQLDERIQENRTRRKADTTTFGFQFARRIAKRPQPVTIPAYASKSPFTGRDQQIRWLNKWAVSQDPVALLEAIGGTGKSALTWYWFNDVAPREFSGMGGRFWWSFYSSSNTLPKFQQTLLQYVTGCSRDEAESLDRMTLGSAVIDALSQVPVLVVMDGFERLLNAYHRFDADTVSEEEITRLRGRQARAVTDPVAFDFVKNLVSIRKSKILITSRLMPDALVGIADQPRPGVRYLILPGLTTQESKKLLSRLGVKASELAVQTFFAPLDNHPLLIGLVAGLVLNYRPSPGDFDRWYADPAHGTQFSVASSSASELSQRILGEALAGLDDERLALLQSISSIAQAATWSMIEAINPYEPNAPHRELDESIPTYLREWIAARGKLIPSDVTISREEATAKLDDALEDLQSRGLLWWNRESNDYDMHPVVRSYVSANTSDHIRRATNRRFVRGDRDYFGRQQEISTHAGEPRSVDDIMPDIRHFRTLILAGALPDAEKLWRTRLNDQIFRLGENFYVLQLLSSIGPEGLSGHGFLTFQWSCATAESHIERDDIALRRWMMILQNLVESRAVNNILPALGNLIISFLNLGASAEAKIFLQILKEFTVYLGNEDWDLARIGSFQLSFLARRGDYRQALQEVRELQAGPKNPLRIFWDEDLMCEEHEFLLKLGEIAVLGEIRLSDYRYGITPPLRESWASLVHEYCMRQGDFREGLEAALDEDHWRVRQGKESLPASAAWALAELDCPDEARNLLREVVQRMTFVVAAQRPYLDIARTLFTLGDIEQAQRFGMYAYFQAREDGSPYCDKDAVEQAASFLRSLGVELPSVPERTLAEKDLLLVPELRAWLRELRHNKEENPDG